MSVQPLLKGIASIVVCVGRTVYLDVVIINLKTTSFCDLMMPSLLLLVAVAVNTIMTFSGVYDRSHFS